MTPEGKVKKEIKDFLDTVPELWYFMPVSLGMGRHGIPDIIGCYKGHFFAVECKAPGKSATALQLRELQAIDVAHGVGIVTDSVSTVQALIALLNERHT